MLTILAVMMRIGKSGATLRHASFALALLGMAWPAAASGGQVTVFAAASLTTALDEVAAAFEADSGHAVTLSYAGSSALARQIERGAPADVFISANRDWMDRLEEAGRIDPGTRIELLGNRLVLIGQADAAPVAVGPDLDLAALLGEGWLAMALVDAVPAGLYGKAALERLGLWQTVSGRVVQANNVRLALRLVSLGEAVLGVVYLTDATADDRVRVLGLFPEDSHPPILYPAAAVAGRDNAAASEMLEYLRAPPARSIFERHGFAVPAE